MLVGAPGLHRAVAECTQPYGPPAGAEVTKALQKYLSDSKCTDTVYKALLNRASIEPKSEVVIQKVVGVLKLHLPRYVPTKEVLTLIDDFCANITACLPASSAGLKKSLAFVKATITLLRNSSSGGGGGRSSNAVPSRLDASPSRHLSNSMGGDGGEGEGGPSDLQRARSLFTMTSVENGQLPPMAADGLGVGDVASAGGPRASLLSRTHREQPPSSRPYPPDWAVPPSVFPLPQTLSVRPSQLRAWAQLLPQYCHSLQVLLGRSGGLSEGDVANSHDALWDLTGQDPDELMQHLEELTTLTSKDCGPLPDRKQKPNMFFCTQPYSQAEQLSLEPGVVEAVLEAVLGVLPPPSSSIEENPQGRAGAGVWASAKVQLWEARGNLPSVGQVCFSILLKLIMDMYVHNGPLLSFPLAHRLLSQGLRNPSAEVRVRVFGILYNLAVHSVGFEAPKPDPPAQTPSESPVQSPAGGLHTPQGGPQGLLPRGALVQDGPGGYGPGSMRGHAYGAGGGGLLSHHLTPPPSPLLQSSGSPGGLPSARGPATPILSTTPLSRAPSADKEVPAGGPKAEQLNRWLLMLLYQMLTELAETEERAEEVWQAALGCVLFMATQSGHFVRAAVEPFPMDMLSQLLQACLHFGWSMELYCHLLHLACHLLICPPLTVDDAKPEGHSWSWSRLDPVRLEALGGAEELLLHFCEAPTHHARRETLCVLLLAVKPEDVSEPEVDAMREVLIAHRPLSDILQVALRSPLPGLAEAVLGAMQQVVKPLPSCAAKLLDRLEQLAVSFLESSLATQVEENMNDILAQGAPDALLKAWEVLAVECGHSQGNKLAAYCVTRLLQGNSQDLQDTLLPSPHSQESQHAQHAQQQVAQVIRSLLDECMDGVSIFIDMVCQLILSFKEEALSSELPELPEAAAGAMAAQPLPSSESGKLLIAQLIINTWTNALEWLATCSAIPPAVLYRVADMVLLTVTCIPGNPTPPALQEMGGSLLASFQLDPRLHIARDREGELNWEALNRMLLPDLVLQGHLPFYVPCLRLLPMPCLVLLLRSFPGDQTSIQRLLLGRPGPGCGAANPLDVPWHDSVSGSRLALLLALITTNMHAPFTDQWTEALESLVDCSDVQVRHLTSVQILKCWFQHDSTNYWQVLQRLLLKAQQEDDEKILLNPYLQVARIVRMGQQAAAAVGAAGGGGGG